MLLDHPLISSVVCGMVVVYIMHMYVREMKEMSAERTKMEVDYQQKEIMRMQGLDRVDRRRYVRPIECVNDIIGNILFGNRAEDF